MDLVEVRLRSIPLQMQDICRFMGKKFYDTEIYWKHIAS